MKEPGKEGTGLLTKAARHAVAHGASADCSKGSRHAHRAADHAGGDAGRCAAHSHASHDRPGHRCQRWGCQAACMSKTPCDMSEMLLQPLLVRGKTSPLREDDD